MKNIQILSKIKQWLLITDWNKPRLAAALVFGLLFAAPLVAHAEFINKSEDGTKQNAEPQEDPPSGYIGTNEEGDSVMRTGPRQRDNNDVEDYNQGIIISPEVTPIVPMRPRHRDPFNPYPGPGPHPGPGPRDGVNQMHEYNYNPEYPLEVPNRSFGGGPRGGGVEVRGGGPRGGGPAF